MGLRILLVCAALPLASLPAHAADRLDTLVEAEPEKQKTPGVGVAILRAGEPLKLQGYGLANVEHKGSDLTVIVLANLAQARPERFTDALAGAVDPTLAPATSQ